MNFPDSTSSDLHYVFMEHFQGISNCSKAYYSPVEKEYTEEKSTIGEGLQWQKKKTDTAGSDKKEKEQRNLMTVVLQGSSHCLSRTNHEIEQIL